MPIVLRVQFFSLLIATKIERDGMIFFHATCCWLFVLSSLLLSFSLNIFSFSRTFSNIHYYDLLTDLFSLSLFLSICVCVVLRIISIFEINRFGFKIVVRNGANKKKSDPLDTRTIRIYHRPKYHRQRSLHPPCHRTHSHIWVLICENRSMPAVWPHFVIHIYRAAQYYHQHTYTNFTGTRNCLSTQVVWLFSILVMFVVHFFVVCSFVIKLTPYNINNCQTKSRRA